MVTDFILLMVSMQWYRKVSLTSLEQEFFNIQNNAEEIRDAIRTTG